MSKILIVDDDSSDDLALAFAEYRERLLALVRKNLNQILLKRMSYEDVLQSAYEATAKRIKYFTSNEDVPVYFKLRTILLQTITDIDRRHLQNAGRDAYKEVEVEGRGKAECDYDTPTLPGFAITSIDRKKIL